jgi:hypothetical protein
VGEKQANLKSPDCDRALYIERGIDLRKIPSAMSELRYRTCLGSSNARAGSVLCPAYRLVVGRTAEAEIKGHYQGPIETVWDATTQE